MHSAWTLTIFVTFVLVSQVLVSIVNVNEPFEHIEVSENETIVLCITVWGPLTEPLHVLVETSDSGIALGESFMWKKYITMYWL